MKLFIFTGLSGSGKSVALKTLEDLEFYCIDNLPIKLLDACIETLTKQGYSNVAISLDVRNPSFLGTLPEEVENLSNQGIEVKIIFLDASNESLLRRYSETRRPHPLSNDKTTLIECIEVERKLLEPLKINAEHIDTSRLTPQQLKNSVRGLVENKNQQFQLILQSFGFKHGIPLDTDFTFDVRCLPNPFYEDELKQLSGSNPKVADYLNRSADTLKIIDDIHQFMSRWLHLFINEGRVTLAISVGCTGGQHRSVYVVEELEKKFKQDYRTLMRHRDLS
ncbi:MAG: RNase adapter RapZ [Proteobacteria bacterium]|nr:RNase adapter RapZ [Pseudomonadota bacterium]MDA1332296.1 RNase adapter RapZ [Pseudomonadota bacterium]